MRLVKGPFTFGNGVLHVANPPRLPLPPEPQTWYDGTIAQLGGGAMSYATITTWELHDGADWGLFLRNVEEHRLPALKELGATRVTVIRTSDRTVAALSEWPDAQTRDDAVGMIEVVRKKVRSDGSRMTGEMMGEVVAEA